MKIKQIGPCHFGGLDLSVPIELEPGLSIWIAKNQAGKTTLVALLEWMLYGPPSKRRVKDSPVLKRWMPWSGQLPGGTLVIEPELKGQPPLIKATAKFRDFQLEVTDATTGAALPEYSEIDKSGDWALGKKLLNLSRESFRYSICAQQGSLIEPLRRGNLRQMLTADLGMLVENPEITAVDRVLEAIETPQFAFADGAPKTLSQHQVAVTKELDILRLERARLEQQLSEFKENLTARDALTSQLEQQKHIVSRLQRQAQQLELARSYYLLRQRKIAPPPAELAQLTTEHPKYAQITQELEHEVDQLYGKLEVTQAQLDEEAAELNDLTSKYEALVQAQSVKSSNAGLDQRRQIRAAAATVQGAHQELIAAEQRCQELAGQIPEEDRKRFNSLQKLYEPVQDQLAAIADWEREHAEIENKLTDLRGRRIELQILTRVHLPPSAYVGITLTPVAVLMPWIFAQWLPPWLTWLGWLMMVLILLIAVLLFSPYWRMRRATGPAAHELRNQVLPAIDEGTRELTALDRRRRRFMELSEIDRPTWDRLVDNILLYSRLDIQQREYQVAARDRDTIKRRLEAAWLEIGEVLPLAPVEVNMPWLTEQLSLISSSATEPDLLQTLATRVAEQRKDVERLTAERDRYQTLMTDKLASAGLGEQLAQGLKAAFEMFRNVAEQLRQLKRAEERQEVLDQTAKEVALTEEEFEQLWSGLSSAEQQRLQDLVATRENYDVILGRLKELHAAQRSAQTQLEQLERTVEALNIDLERYGRLDREAEDISKRLAKANRSKATIERWQAALKIARRLVASLVDRASQDIAPEIDRALKQILSAAPIEGIPEVRLGQLLELAITVKGAPPDIPVQELWTYLSSGAQQQLALAVRLAMARTASGRTNLPLILDEPLAELDDDRAAAVFQYITRLAQSTQVVLTTCHQRLYEWLLERHGAANELQIPGRV